VNVDADLDAVDQAQASLRRRILHAFGGRGLLECFEAKELLGYRHSGFSVDAGVCIEAENRATLERLLRYCARPPFAMERLRKEGAALVYRCAKQRSEPTSDKWGTAFLLCRFTSSLSVLHLNLSVTIALVCQ
jgi:hypothetical protein